GGWTSTESAVVIAAGELVTVRLADTAGVVFWSLIVFATDELTTTAPTLSLDLVTHTATFTAPADTNGGYAFSFQSQVGVTALGQDANFAVQDSYTTRFKLGTLA